MPLLPELSAARYFLRRHNYVWLPGAWVQRALPCFGATPAGIRALARANDGLEADPTLAFRRTRNGRFGLDFGAGVIRRLEPQGFILDKADGFEREDSGMVRHFGETTPELQRTTGFQALLRLKAALMPFAPTLPRRGCDPESQRWICTCFNLRTQTTRELLGEPAAEGVHQDGVEYTMTTLLDSENMAPHSAFSRLHDLQQRTGASWAEADPALVVKTVQHRHFLDTLVIVDNKLSHSVSAVYQEDPDRMAVRDMLVFFTRRPALPGGGHPSEPYDSLRPHPRMPMEVPLVCNAGVV